MIQNPFDNFGHLHFLGDVSAFEIEITPEDIANSTAYHAFNLTASSGCKVRWGDGTETECNASGLYSHTYASAGRYLIQILGAHTTFNHDTGATPSKVVEGIKLYSGVTYCNYMWKGCNNSKFKLNHSFKVHGNVTSMAAMLAGATYFNNAVNHWDVSNVTSMYYCFSGCSNFNQSLSSWNVSKVTNFGSTFSGCSSFNQSLSNWNISNATNLNSMFYGASSFNQELDSWDMSKVTNMGYMFCYCGTLQYLGDNFTTPDLCTNCESMFYDCKNASFHLPSVFRIGNAVTNCSNMFFNCYGSAFNLPAGFTIPNSVLYCNGMFYNCYGISFNLPEGFTIGTGVTAAGSMFYGCGRLTSLPDSFVIPANVIYLDSMFKYCFELTADISNIFPDWTSGTIQVQRLFESCYKITGTLPAEKLWNNTNVTWVTTSTFFNCTSLSNYDNIPTGWK